MRITLLVFCGAPLLLAALPLDYLLRVAAVMIHRAREAGSARKPMRGWRWWVTPICLLLIIAAFSSKGLLRARFALSQPAFERVAAACLAGNCPAGSRWIGLYFVDRVELSDPKTVCFATGESIIDPVGLEFQADSSGSTFGFPGWYEVEW